MGFTTPIVIPLAKGLDLSKEATLGQDELHTALNVDFAVDGAIQGRPSRSAPLQFVVRDPASTTKGMLSAADFSATGFTARGLMRLRDANGERAALATDGRLFTQDGSRWVDRGPFACAKVDRVVNFEGSKSAAATSREGVSPTFGPSRVVNSSTQYYALLTDTYAVDREVVSTFPAQLGGSRGGNAARCGTTTAIVSDSPVDNKLIMVYRVDGQDTINVVTLATDALDITDDGDSPAICCSSDATAFFVVYETTTANVFKVLKVTTTGTVSATYTSAAVPGLAGFWVDNTSVATNRVVVAFTHTGGITLRQLNATTMVDVALDATHDGSDGAGTVGLDCVVGLQSDNIAWWAYRNSNAVGSGDLVIGVYKLSTGTASRQRKYWGGDTYTEASIRWGIAHQPLLVNGRVYFTIVAATNNATTGTWLTLDLTNWLNTTAGTGPFANPTMVARGPTQATIPYFQAASAIPLDDDSGFTFATLDWSRFETNGAGSLTGADASLGLNRVTFSGPRCAQAGESTIFSGSVPHVVSRGQCAELGFPFLAGIPGFSVAATGGGAVGTGSYTLYACWRWVDEAGQIHRSAPSLFQTVAVPGGGTSTITAVVSNPWLSSKDYGDVKIEVYCTDLNPTDDADHYLQQAVTPTYTAAYTTVTINTQPVTTTEALYTDGGVFGNYHVPGDGGVAALGRRVWLASGNTLYASKLLLTGYAPGFSDESSDGIAPLFMTLPAGAGRIVALETLDDKLLVFCQRGVYIVQDGGPDNTGLGSDFASPVRLSDLTVAGPRSVCQTDAGVVFCTALSATDPSRGGPWLIDRQLTLTDRQYLGRPAAAYFAEGGAWACEVAYSPERQQVFITVPDADLTGTSGVVVIDMRVGKWATWTLQSADGVIDSITTVEGVLWALGTNPAPFDGTPGTDDSGDVTMTVSTSQLFADGTNGIGWARVRGISVMGAENSGNYDLSISALQDGAKISSSGTIACTSTGLSTTWPANRQVPEWRLPVQKCSSLQVVLTATPATAKWSAIRLEVQPLPNRAPAKQRV